MSKEVVLKTVMASLLTSVVHVAVAADIRDQFNVQTSKAELVVPNARAQDVAAQVKDALSQFAIPSSYNVHSLPAALPAHPLEPTLQDFLVQGQPVSEYQCRNGYAEVTKTPAPIKNPFMFAAERVQACLYPFERGVKIYLIFASVKKTESLTAGLFNGITSAIRGKDEDYNAKRLKEEIAAIRKNLPQLLVEKIDIPGTTLEEPDKDAVAKLMPARSETIAQPSVTALPAGSPSISGKVGVASQSNSKVEARKSLAGMGLTYHSAEQFFAAIRRDDDVAVQLFLAAGSMKILTKDTNGKTPEQAALESSASAAWEAIRQFAADNPQAAAKAPTNPAADPAQALAAARESLSPEVLDGIEKMIKEQRLSGAEAEAFRTKATLQYAIQFKGIPKTMMK
ncbi:hypothetical protein [Janthinobacterium sp. RT4P48]|uniref:hypothetical protein n=1 Tax=Janthinobacterium sp. RT4P48 TaxID=3424188 RepID=UPI003F250966